MKFQYTEPAIRELDEFQARQKKILEELISEKKFVYGDDTIEITASDIKECSESIRATGKRTNKSSLVSFVSQSYIFLGLLITIGGFWFPKFQAIYLENRLQAFTIVTGLLMLLLGFLVKSFYKNVSQLNHEKSLHAGISRGEIIYPKDPPSPDMKIDVAQKRSIGP